MSVNLFLEIEVRGWERSREKRIRAAIRELLVREGIERDFGKLDAKDGVLRASTPVPVIVSASYAWLPVMQKALAAAVTKANGKKCKTTFTAESGDEALEEEGLSATPGPLLAPKPKGFERYEDVVARTPTYLVFSCHDTLVTKTTEWPPRNRVLPKLAVQGADEAPDGSLVLLSKGRVIALADPLASKPRVLRNKVARLAFAGDRLLIVEDKSWKASVMDLETGKLTPVTGAPKREPITFTRCGDFVIWNDAAYVLEGSKLVEVISKMQHTSSAALAADGTLHYLGRSGQLLTQSQSRGGKPAVVPYDGEAHWSKEVALGPQGSLLLRLCENYQRAVASVFFPAEKKFFYLGQKQFAVGDDSESLFHSPRTGRVICVGRGKMIGLPVEKLTRFAKRPVNAKAWSDHVKRYASLYED